PPPQPDSAKATMIPSRAEGPRIRIVCPPGREVGKRARILTDPPQTVNSERRHLVWLLAALVALSPALATAAAPVPTRGEWPVLVVMASFPDRPMSRSRDDVGALVDRLVAYWTEVSSGRLRLVPHLGAATVTTPLPRAQYVQQPLRLARDALHAFDAV